MSAIRHSDLRGPTSRSLAHREEIDWHDHPVHQLIYPLRGVLQVATARGAWVVPPNRAVWIPARVPHAHQAHGPTEMRTLVFDIRLNPLALDTPTVLDVSPLLREVIRALTDAQPRPDDPPPTGNQAPPGDLALPGDPALTGGPASTDDPALTGGPASTDDPALTGGPASTDDPALTGGPALTGRALPEELREHLSQVVLLELRRVEALPLWLPAPTDPRLVDLARLLADDPADSRSLPELGRAVGASERTLSRLFREQTGITFPQWRGQLRLHHALKLLATGAPVTRVAVDCGYRSPSAFIEAFRLAFGTTPGRYQADATGTRP